MNSDGRNERLGTVSRRAAIRSMAGATAAVAISPALEGLASPATKPHSTNPRWYGFNLLEYFSTDPDWTRYFPPNGAGRFKEDDFRWMRDWGFTWVRLPMDYRFWTDPKDWMKIEEKKVEPIDRAIRLGETYGIHVNISLHRAPGECILDGMDAKLTDIHVTPEKTSVYRNVATLDAFVHQWTYFAKRYKGISSDRLSFNLVNEPDDKNAKSAADGRQAYARIARAAIGAIRAIDPSRLIVSDGYPYATAPAPELFDTGVLQSVHDYVPSHLTGYRCAWLRYPGSDKVPMPTWPLRDTTGKIVGDRQTIEAYFQPWAKLAERGIPMHCGEMGCGRFTPPKVVYAWFDVSLDVIGSLHTGWALWNFRGPFGILDSKRAGTRYTDWHGHQLDSMLLHLLQSKIKV